MRLLPRARRTWEAGEYLSATIEERRFSAAYQVTIGGRESAGETAFLQAQENGIRVVSHDARDRSRDAKLREAKQNLLHTNSGLNKIRTGTWL
jgi:hypothetical protein